MYVTAVVVFGTLTVLNVMEAGGHEQQEFLDNENGLQRCSECSSSM